MIQSNKIINFPIVISTFILLVFVFLPSYRSSFTLPILASIEMLYGIVFFKNFLPNLRQIAIPVLGYALMTFIFAKSYSFKLGFLHPLMSLWIWVFPIIMAYELIKKNNFQTNRIIFYFMIVLLMIVIISTLKFIATNPVIMRNLTAVSKIDPLYEQELLRNNVGGFGIAYGCGAILIAYFGSFRALRPHGIIKWFSLGMMIILSLLVIQAQFTTLLILVAGCVLFQIILSSKNRINTTLIAVLIFLMFIFSENILLFIIDWYKGTATASNLQLLYDSLFQGQEYDSYRRKFLSNAIDVFLSSPIWGNDMSNINNYLAAAQCHSTILAVSIKTGVIGLFCYLYTFWLAFKPIYLSWSEDLRLLVGIPLIAYYILLSYLNPTENDVFSLSIGLISIMSVYFIAQTEKEHDK